MADKTLTLIKQKEGYSSTAYLDKTAYRIGYGSDTMTDSAGNVVRVTKSSTTTKADAQRDLERRVPEFQQSGIIQYVGQEAWDAMTDEARASVTSLAYNYGSLSGLPSLVTAIKSGDNNAIGNAIADRAVDNDGENSARRKAEAALVLGGPSVPAGISDDPPTVMPRSAGSDARAKAAARTSLLSGGAAVTAGRSPVAAPDLNNSAIRSPVAAPQLGGTPVRSEPVPGLRLPVAPVSAPLRTGTSILTGGLSPTERDERNATGGANIGALIGKPPSVVKTTGGIAGTAVMPAGARPSIVPAPTRSSSSSSSTASTVLTGGLSPTERDEAKAATTSSGLPKPAPLIPAVYKTISVINPAWQDDVGPGASLADLNAFRGQPGGIAAAGAGAVAGGAKSVPKYIQKRVLVTPARAGAPVAAPARPVVPATTVIQKLKATGMSSSQAYATAASRNNSGSGTTSSGAPMTKSDGSSWAA